jgi:ribosome-associated heat shock protein Hsp15
LIGRVRQPLDAGFDGEEMPKQKSMTDAETRASTGIKADASEEGQRLDKWLWYARVVKSRTLASGLVQGGKVRINRERTTKPSQTIRPGDVITIAVHRQVRVLKVVAGGTRRGPAKEAVALYEDLSPAPVRRKDGEGVGEVVGNGITFEAGAGRPTKRDRREIDKLRGV